MNDFQQGWEIKLELIVYRKTERKMSIDCHVSTAHNIVLVIFISELKRMKKRQKQKKTNKQLSFEHSTIACVVW